MIPRFDIRYVNRENDRIEQEKVFAEPFLRWSYNSASGRWLTRLVLSRQVVSRPFGWLCRRRFSRRLIGPFLRATGLEPSVTARYVAKYRTFRDFFIREDPSVTERRNVDEAVCLAPADGKVIVVEEVSAKEVLRIKRSTFNLTRLLGDGQLAQVFDRGTVAVFRLCLTDHHRFYFPVSGTPQAARPIHGRYYAGGPYDQCHLTPFYSENSRMVTLIESTLFGTVAMVEIGAFTVGSIVQTYEPGMTVEAGQQKGWFEPGGSTVVLVFQRNTIEVDPDLRRNSRLEFETRLRCGEAFGRARNAERRAV